MTRCGKRRWWRKRRWLRCRQANLESLGVYPDIAFLQARYDWQTNRDRW